MRLPPVLDLDEEDELDEDDELDDASFLHVVDWGHRYLEGRGLYRVFGPAVYNFFRSSTAPPLETDVPYANSATLPATPATTFANGTWWLSVSYFNGVIDSGFLPIGPNGETFVKLTITGGAAVVNPPQAPLNVQLELRAGGVVRVHAVYAEQGAARADTWAIAYTTNGSSPTAGSPTATQAFLTTSSVETLSFDIPAQPDGTTVKVLVQTRRAGTIYSDPSAILTAIADAVGPAAIGAPTTWPGDLPEKTT